MQSLTSLLPYNTFALDVHARELVIAHTINELLSAYLQAKQKKLPFLLLGEGSNVLFLANFLGVVAINRLLGKEITEDKSYWYLHVGAGENWHQLVQYTIDQGISGLENLALIPGCVGSAPIQNIGAYGVELKDVCQYVDVLNLQTGETARLTTTQCQFAYRDSIFKHQYQQNYAIIAVGFQLAKRWQPHLTYGELKQLDKDTVTAEDVFHIICQTRRQKLPDPHVMGNAGSFFKNPLVTEEKAQQLLQHDPTMPIYWQADGQAKLAAGWLIDRCGLKGYAQGNAAVHQHQALVLVNKGKAQPQEIVALAKCVRQAVIEKFSVVLEAEVRFISGYGEVDSHQVLA